MRDGPGLDRPSRLFAGFVQPVPEQRVALASSTRVEWILADLGILCAGAATTTVYPQTNADESAYILSDSQSRVLVAENAEQVAKAVEKRAELPELTHVVAVDPAGVETDDFVITLADLEKLGTARLQKEPELIKERVAAITKAERVSGNALGFEFETTEAQREALRLFMERILSENPAKNDR